MDMIFGNTRQHVDPDADSNASESDTEDEWQKLTDESTGRVTYYNTRTQETSTTKPESAHDKFVRSLRTKFKILTGLFQILNQVWFSSSLQLVLLSSLLG